MSVRILVGDALAMLRGLESESVQCVVTSPPYFQLRDYGVDGQIGLEQTPLAFLEVLWAVFDEVRRVLRPDGLCFVNLAPSYSGSGRGPTGKNGIGDQARRQGFVGGASGGSDPSRSHGLGHAPACDSDGTGRSGSHRLDSAYFGLCDGCLADFLSHRARNADTLLPQHSGEPLLSKIDRGTGPLDVALGLPVGAAHDAPSSTMLESWRQLRGSCSRCDTRAASFGRIGLPIDGRAARECARTMASPSAARLAFGATQDLRESNGCNGETGGSSADRIQDMGDAACSCRYSTIVDHPLKPKDMILIPEMFALGMQARGWYVRQQIVWAKKSCMPESVRDRFTRSWESIWMFAKSGRYFFDQEAVRQPGVEPDGRHRGPKLYTDGAYHRNGIGSETLGSVTGSANMRDVWLLGPEPSREEHYASYPTEIVRRCILAGTSQAGACPSCGAPWARVVERTKGDAEALHRPKHLQSAKSTLSLSGNGSAEWAERGSKAQTVGWQASCPHVERYCPSGCIGPITGDEAACIQCGALWQWRQPAPVPCVVLDPFLGSGTTLMVASRFGRDGIGVELNPEYAKMAEGKIQRDAGALFPEDIQVAAPRQPTLFDEQEAV